MTCPDCGGPTRQAFPTTTAYVSCRRCGHVHPTTPQEGTIKLDARLDELNSEAFDRLTAACPGKPMAADTVTEMVRGMARAFDGGYHPDTPSDGYTSYPEGYDAFVVTAIEAVAEEHGVDIYEVAVEVALAGVTQ